MNTGQIKQRVRTKFGDTSGAELTDTDLLSWINDGLTEIARRTQQPQATATGATVAGTSSYSIATLAADMLRLRSVMLDGTVLSGLSIEEADALLGDREQAGQGRGTPRYFWVFADQINLWPIPSAAGSLKLSYVKRPATVTVDGDSPGIPVHMHVDLVDYVVAQVLESTGDADRADRRMGRFEASAAMAAADAEWPVRGTYPHVTTSPDDVAF